MTQQKRKKKTKNPKNKPCIMLCGREAVTRGYCRSCYIRSKDPRVGQKRIETTCLVCGVKIHVYPGQRYCKEHERLRAVQSPLTVAIESRWKPVQFNGPEPCETLLWAARSIRMYRPDGTLDEERTSIERGRWLTRKLQGPWTEAN